MLSVSSVALFISVTAITFSSFGQSQDSIRNTLGDPQYYELDVYAKNTPEKYAKSLDDLTSYLDAKATNDLEKARLIFTWIATHIHYDDKAYNSGRYPDQTAKSVLKRKTAVCAGFSSLYLNLANQMGLTCEKVSGYAKGYGYVKGRKFSKPNHDWNAVKVDGDWHLIDVTWASCITETTKAGVKTTMIFDDQWFFVSPMEFVFSHLPADKKWQLERPKVSMKEYIKRPFVSETVFKIFKGKEIVEAVNDSKPIVKGYSSKYRIKAIDAPLTGTLIKGQTYVFKFESAQVRRVALTGNAQWIFLTRENGTFSGVITPKSNQVQVAIAMQSDYSTWETILQYDVVERK